MIKVVIASKNPVKINATRLGFEKMFPGQKFKFFGISAPSGVSDQPMSEAETAKGATNRVKNVSKLAPKADYWVGIEGGLEEKDGKLEAFDWTVIKSKKGKFGIGRTASFFLPKKEADLIKEGKELGEAGDIVFGQTNSKQNNGTIGLLTSDVITRTTFYESAIILALIPFKNPKLY